MRISDEKRDLVIKLYMADVTQKDIASFTQISLRSVSTIIKNAASKEPLRKTVELLQKQIKDLQTQVNLLKNQLELINEAVLQLHPQNVHSLKSINKDILAKNKLHDSSKKELMNIATSNHITF